MRVAGSERARSLEPLPSRPLHPLVTWRVQHFYDVELHGVVSLVFSKFGSFELYSCTRTDLGLCIIFKVSYMRRMKKRSSEYQIIKTVKVILKCTVPNWKLLKLKNEDVEDFSLLSKIE